MGMRFRKSVKLLPGVRMNVSKRSIGMSVGPRGAKVSVNSKGRVGTSAGIPGTGLSYQQSTTLKKGPDPNEIAALSPEEMQQLDPAVLEWAQRRLIRRLIGWSCFGLFLLLIFAGQPTVAGYLLIPMVLAVWLGPLVYQASRRA